MCFIFDGEDEFTEIKDGHKQTAAKQQQGWMFRKDLAYAADFERSGKKAHCSLARWMARRFGLRTFASRSREYGTEEASNTRDCGMQGVILG